ncbi:Ig-like domain-containing protein, partial [Vibrio proteolyticus]
AQTQPEDFTPYTIDLNDAFSDVDNADSELTFSVSGNSHIQVTIVDGVATITPTADWNGSETLTFTATDPSGESVSQAVDFTVLPVVDIADDSADVVEETPTIINVLDNDSFEGTPVVSVTPGQGPSNGSIMVNADGTITYTPNDNYNGADSFTYTVTSGGVTETATVAINVTPVNDAPQVESTIPAQTQPEDFTPYTIDLNDAFSDVDNADSELTFSVSGNSHIQVTIVDGLATITPTADWNGSETLTFTATDPSGESVSQAVDFTVLPVVDIADDSADVVEETPTIINVLGNDSFEGTPVVSVAPGQGPSNGSIMVNADGTITYTPNDNYNGADSFTYTVTSGGVTETATVAINVTPVNDTPIASPTVIETLEDTSVLIAWSQMGVSDIDTADDQLGVQATALPANGTLEYQDSNGVWQLVAMDQILSKSDFDSGKVRFTPELNESGYDQHEQAGVGDQHQDYAQFSFKPTDGDVTGDEVSISIDVTPVADKPNLDVTNPELALPQQNFNVSTWSGVNIGGHGGNGVQGSTLVNAINALSSENAATSQIANAQQLGTNATPADTAVLITGLAYLEAGVSYDFVGNADDSFALLIGGAMTDVARWGSNSGSIQGDSFTPTVSGFYPISIYHHNQSGPGNFDLNVKIDGQDAVDLSNSHLSVVTDAQALQETDIRTSDLMSVDGVEVYQVYGVNEGAQDTRIPLSEISSSLVDSDDSETLTLTLEGLPVGATLSDGVNEFEMTDSGQVVDITDWDLDSLSVLPPAGSSDDFSITVTSTASEHYSDSTASSVAQIDVTVYPNVPTIAQDDSALGQEDTTVSGNVLANDTDPDSALSVVQFEVNGVEHPSGDTVALNEGALTLNPDGSYEFVPSQHWSGDVPTIVYTTNTGKTATLDISVEAVADAPLISVNVGDLQQVNAVPDFSTLPEDIREQINTGNLNIGGIAFEHVDTAPAFNNGNAGNDLMIAPDGAAPQSFVGDTQAANVNEQGSDMFIGTSGNDSFYGGNGSQDSETAIDSVVYQGSVSEYVIEYRGYEHADQPYWLVKDSLERDTSSDNSPHTDDGDHLYGIERLYFKDGIIELHPDGTHEILTDKVIPVEVDVALVDTDGSETLNDDIVITGIPDGVSLLVNGQEVTRGSDGAYTLSLDNDGDASFELKVPYNYQGTLDFPIEVTAASVENSNNDTAEQSVTENLSFRDYVLSTGSYGDDTIEGSEEHDLIVGDVRGLQIVAGEDYNIAFVLDTSGSMGWDVETAKSELLVVFDTLLESAQGDHAGQVNVLITDFSTGLNHSVSVDLSSSDPRSQFVSALNQIGDQGSGNTNYEAAFKGAVDWFATQEGGNNITYFISDGEPQYATEDDLYAYQFDELYLDYDAANNKLITLADILPSNYTSGVVMYKGQEIIDKNGKLYSPLTGARLGDMSKNNISYDYYDRANVTQQSQHMYQLLALMSSVEAIGIGYYLDQDTLDDYDSDGVVDTAIDVSDLSNVILGKEIDLLQGGDTIDAKSGDDILFGDLVQFDGISGQGVPAIQKYVAAQTGEELSAVNARDIHEYIREHVEEFDQSRTNDKADTLVGGEGNDILFGQGGDDTLDGGLGNDILIGGTGQDTLIGGLGDDILTGGADADIFKWTEGSLDNGTDVVEDFQRGEDVLDFSDIVGETGHNTMDELLSSIQVEISGNDLTLDIPHGETGESQTIVIKNGADAFSDMISADPSGFAQDVLNSLTKHNVDS